MNYIDVFNGDADGICSLIQLRLAEPRESKLVTGIKRNINLLKQLELDSPCCITVLDISFEKNALDVQRLLDDGAIIDYIDHHKTGELIEHQNLKTSIDLNSNICTALLVDNRLNGQFKEWAITAAFGDNLSDRARQLGTEFGLSPAQLDILSELGILLNYNGYGETVEDLFFHPAELYQKCLPFQSPFDFIDNDKETFITLKQGYEQDMNLARQSTIREQSDVGTIIELPNEKWARRISGVYGNLLANESPSKAHAVIQLRSDNQGYLVSIRAPLTRKYGADELATQFPTGGGRKAAAGINSLPIEMLDDFIQAFDTTFRIDV